jgi:hypothetical protein
MTSRKLLTVSVALAVAANTRVAVLPGWVVPVPAVFLAVALAVTGGLAALLALRLRPARPVPAWAGIAAVKAVAIRRGCAYCGNTGTVNGDWCPVCHPNGGGGK